jgi:phosphoribosyl 1,2-cyclic phosphate phosphodiesterase
VEARQIGTDLVLGNSTIRYVDQPHGDVTSLGLRIDEPESSVVYAIDFNAMTQDMLSLYDCCSVLICDCLQRSPHPTHAHLDAVLGWAKDLRAGRLYLTHMNASMDYATLVRELPDWAEPAHDGLEILL